MLVSSMRQNWRYHPPAEDRRCQSPSRPILRGFWASSCPRGMNGRLSVMKKRLCAEDPSTPNPTHWWLPWCLSVASLPCGPPLTPESQPTATVPSAPANQHYVDFSSVHRAVEDMQTTLLKHRVGSRCSVKSAWLFQAAACQQAAWPRPAMCQAPIPYLFRGEHT